MFKRPVTFALLEDIGSLTDGVTPEIAARWKTVSGSNLDKAESILPTWANSDKYRQHEDWASIYYGFASCYMQIHSRLKPSLHAVYA